MLFPPAVFVHRLDTERGFCLTLVNNYKSKMDYRAADKIIKLSQNENPLGPSPLAIAAVSEYCDTMHRYPEPHSHTLQEKLADRLYVSPENVFVSAGLVESLDILIRNFVGPDENMILGEVTFVAYRLMADVFGVTVRTSKMKDYRIDVDDILRLYDESTRLIIIANPNNPTGTTISELELIRLMENVSPDTLVVVDEAYMEYVTQVDFPNSLGLWERYQNMIVMRTFSKIYGLAGMRVGYSVASKEIVEKFGYYQAPFTVNKMGMVAAMAAIDDVEFVEESVRLNKEGREYMFKELTNFGCSIVPSQSNFLYLSFPSTKERDRIHDIAADRSIFVRKMDPFGDSKSLRLTIGRPEHNEKILECFQPEEM